MEAVDLPILRSTKFKRLAASLLLGAFAATGTIAARPSEVSIGRDVPFATRGGERLSLDVYRPDGQGPHPVAVLVHGGSWKLGSKKSWQRLGPRIADAGFVAFSVDYRLTSGPGEVRHPAPVGDLAAALAWVEEHAADYGGDPERVAMIGSSAGGHLALLLAAGERAHRPDAVVALSPPVDMTALAAESLGTDVETYLGCDVETCPERYRRASPLDRITASMPPVFLAYSAGEFIPRSQEDALARRLDTLEVDHEVRVFEGSRHAIELGDAVLDDVLAFLQRHLD
ncbi:MAG: alpha/beta fold hydrolase [Actinobacteria bacterium]|jgi:acetyl esterase/lipase|nr:alpha/beta fold hydrolase [Actinomycetota bacterium]